MPERKVIGTFVVRHNIISTTGETDDELVERVGKFVEAEWYEDADSVKSMFDVAYVAFAMSQVGDSLPGIEVQEFDAAYNAGEELK